MQRKVMQMKLKGTWTRILGLLTVIAFLTACGTTGTGDTPAASTPASTESSAATTESPAASTAAGGGEPIRIGSKNFTEQFILGEMYAQLLEANGLTVERKLNLGATDIAHQALLNDELDLYPEYTSTGLLTVLKLPQQSDREEIFNTVKSEYEEQFQLTWLEPAPFNNTQALAMTKERAQELGITTYSDLSEKAGELVLGGPPEFFEREDGLQALQEAYGGFEFQDTRQLDPGLRYQALQDGQIDVVVAFGTDGQIGGFDLQLLEDDQAFYPPYQAAPVIRQDTLEANPQIAEILNELAPLLDDGTMADLNWMVDGDEKMEPADVARQFLTEQGLLE
jgi:osmoprotectant transport system substrate-binding protein